MTGKTGIDAHRDILLTRLLDEKVRDTSPTFTTGKADLTYRQLVLHLLKIKASKMDKDAMKLLNRMLREIPQITEKLNHARAYEEGLGSGNIFVPYETEFRNCPYHLAIADAVKARREGRDYVVDPALLTRCGEGCFYPAEPGLLPLPPLEVALA